MEEKIWDGKDPLEVGHVARVKKSTTGPGFSGLYHIPEEGQHVTILARDKQNGATPVRIVRWYDKDLNICLSPIMAHLLEAPCSEEALIFVSAFQKATGLTLDVKDVQKALDIIEEDNDTTSNDELVEVTILSSADIREIENCDFPITFKMSQKDVQSSGSCFGIPRWFFDSIKNSTTEGSDYDQDDMLWFLKNREIVLSPLK